MKRILSLLLAIVMLFSIASVGVTANAGSGIDHSNVTQLNDSSNINGDFGFLDINQQVYSIKATSTTYYRFSVTNESIEVRTGIYGDKYVTSFANWFMGYIEVNVYNSRDMRLAQTSIKCGYVGNITLRLEKGETYYIVLNAVSSGNYNLKVRAYNDIDGNDWTQATETDPTGSFVSAIDVNGDVDWLTFETDKDESFYSFSIENISVTSSLSFTLYEYVEGAGDFPFREIKSISIYSSDTSKFNVKLKTNTKYYYKLSSSGNGGYLVNTEQKFDAVSDSKNSAYSVDLNEKYTTSIDGGYDKDWFKFTTGDDDAYYHIDINNLSVSSNFYAELWDETGTNLKKTSSYFYDGQSRNINAKLKNNTTYFVAIYTESNVMGNYEFKIQAKLDEFGDVKSQAKNVNLSEKISTSLDGDDDVDWVKFTTGNEDAYYHIDINNLSISSGFCAELWDEAGTKLKKTSSYFYDGLSRNINAKLKNNTTYYLAFYDDGSNSGNYEFKIKAKLDEFSDVKSEAKNVELNAMISTSLDGDYDTDWVKFTTGNEDAYYHIDINNLSISSGFCAELSDETGTMLKKTSSYFYDGQSRNINAKLKKNTTYYVAFYDDGSYSGNYEFKITMRKDAESDTADNAKSVSINKRHTYDLASSSDVDWFKVTVPKDDCYMLDVFNESDDNTTYATLYNRYEKEIVKADSYYSAKTIALEEGTYYIKISGSSASYYTFVLSDCGNGHKYDSGKVITASTCTSKGIKKYTCTHCGAKKNEELDYKPHNYKKVVKTKATFSSDGYYDNKCTVCGACDSWSSHTIPSIYRIELSSTLYTYDGKAKKPSVKVYYDYYNNKISSKYYDVTYPKDCTSVGKHSVKITFKGDYKGSKTLKYTIKPKKTSISKLSAKKKGFAVKWGKVSKQISGYQIQYSRYGDFSSANTVSVSSKSTSKTVKGLKSRTKYYVRVRTYKTVNGTKYYSNWSGAKSVTTKK